MLTAQTLRRVLLTFVLVVIAAGRPAPARAGNPAGIQIPADQGGFVRLVSGGPNGFGTVAHGLPVGAPVQVFHIKWQEFGWAPAHIDPEGKAKGAGWQLWVISDHGVPKPRPEGAIPWSVMDHTLAIIFQDDGKTPRLVAEMIPEAEGNWNVYEEGHEKFKFYMEQLDKGELVPGKRGRVKDVRVGRIYGLGDHCCTNEANSLVGHGTGPGTPARGLNRLGLELHRLGITGAVRDTWQAFGAAAGLVKAAWARIAPTPDGFAATNLTRMWRVGNARIPYTPSVGGVMMGISFAIHARKEGLVPATISAGVGIVVWEVGTRATIKAVSVAAGLGTRAIAGRAAGQIAAKTATKIGARAIPIIGEVLLAADIALFLTNCIVGAEAGWGDVWDAYTGKLDKPTFLAGPPPPPDAGAYYD